MAVIRWGTAAPGLDESWPVRYRFESLVALQRHLRAGRGFLLPDGALPAGASRVIVEVGLPEANDRPLLHGRVRERDADGIWLDLPMARPAARWTPDPNAPRRRSPRVACDLLVEIHPEGALPLLCRALDVSDRGVRLGTALETGVRGDRLRAVLLSADGHLPPAEIDGRVVWAAARETGLELTGESAEFRTLLALAASRWDLVREVAHGPSCACAQGAATGQRQP
jgi:hypothetical protein